jgi:hypothetical protein
MKKGKNLKILSTEISNNLIDTIYLVEILEDFLNYSGKEEILVRILKKKIKSSFYKIEKCRKMISFVD